MLFYSYFLHYVPETYLYRNLIRSCKSKGEFLVSIFCLLRVLGIFGRLRAILLPAEKKNMARLKLVGIALNINKTLRLAKEFCCFVTTVKPLLFKADTGLN